MALSTDIQLETSRRAFILLRHGPVPRMEPMAAAMGSHGYHIPVVRPPLRMQNRMVRHVHWENAPTACLSSGTKCGCSDGMPVRGWTTGPLHAHGSTAKLSETEQGNRLHISLINRNYAA